MEPYSSQYLTSGHGSAGATAEVHRSQSALAVANVSFMKSRLSNYAARLDAHSLSPLVKIMADDKTQEFVCFLF